MFTVYKNIIYYVLNLVKQYRFKLTKVCYLKIQDASVDTTQWEAKQKSTIIM